MLWLCFLLIDCLCGSVIEHLPGRSRVRFSFYTIPKVNKIVLIASLLGISYGNRPMGLLDATLNHVLVLYTRQAKKTDGFLNTGLVRIRLFLSSHIHYTAIISAENIIRSNLICLFKLGPATIQKLFSKLDYFERIILNIMSYFHIHVLLCRCRFLSLSYLSDLNKFKCC